MDQKKQRRGRSRQEMGRRLAAYSAAVGAGVALSQPAGAAIIYQTGLSDAFGPLSPLALSLEGATDVTFYGSAVGSTVSYGPSFRSLRATGEENFVMATTASSARRLAAGAVIDAALMSGGASVFGILASQTVSYSGSPGFAGGQWANDGDRGFMAFRFEPDGGGTPMFGWADIERVDGSNGVLHGWAYESTGAPITAGQVPEPSGLALLALGAAGLAALRRGPRKA
jgi:hypothetical protein